MKKSKYKNKRNEGDMFDFLRKHNPKHFYSLFAKGKSKSGKCSLTNDDFQAYFKRLIEGNSVDHTESTCDSVNYNAVYEELHKEITYDEIIKAIKKLKCNKSCSEDYIVNKLFMRCNDILMRVLYKLFNKILMSGLFPDLWTKSGIVPVHKKGDIDYVNN